MNYVYVYCNPDSKITQTSSGPLPGTPFYIGMGTGKRHLSHLREALRVPGPKTNRTKFNAIRALLAVGQVPIIVKIKEELTRSEAKELEIKLIAEIGTLKPVEGVHKRGPLTNFHKGGGGRSGPLPPGTGEKISAARKALNITLSEQHKTALHSGGKNRVRTPEENARRAASISKANTADVVTKRISARVKSGWYSKEALERRAVLVENGALKHTEETKYKISESVREAMAKNEIREKMRKAAAKRWADPAEAKKISERNSKTYELVHRVTGERIIVKNISAWCLENKTYHRKVWKEYEVTIMDTSHNQ